MTDPAASPFLVRPADVDMVEGQHNPLHMQALVRAGDCDADLSATWVQIHGRHGRIRSDRATRLYYILDGRGSMTVGDTRFDVAAGDLAIVPRGIDYDYEGVMTLLLVNQPAFQPGDDIRLD